MDVRLQFIREQQVIHRLYFAPDDCWFLLNFIPRLSILNICALPSVKDIVVENLRWKFQPIGWNFQQTVKTFNKRLKLSINGWHFQPMVETFNQWLKRQPFLDKNLQFLFRFKIVPLLILSRELNNNNEV